MPDAPPALPSGAPPDHPGVRFPPPLLFVAGLAAGWALDRAWPLPLFGAGPASAAVALGLGAGGLGLIAWAMATFRRAHTAILPFRPASGVVEAGPYRFSRNPMYVGMAAVTAGAAVALDTLWPVLLLPVVFAALVALVVRPEERYLAAAFGPAYAAYRARVRRWL